MKYVDPSGETTEEVLEKLKEEQEDWYNRINWSTVGQGIKQTVFGGLQTIWGGAEVAAGAAIATGGTATGIGAVPGIAAGVGVGALGVNNVVGGGTTFASGLTNLYRGFTGQSSVDYSFDPAYKAIDYAVPQGTGNTAAHIGYTVVDIVGGGAGIWKAGGMAGATTIKVSEKIANQMGKRGWTDDLLNSTRNNSFTTREALNKATGNKATAYFSKDGSYVVIDNVTNDIVQVSNRLDPKWTPDLTIVNPYIPK